MNRLCATALATLIVSSLLLGGCGPSEQLGRIGGTVTFQGRPVSKGMVLFSCIDKGVNMTAQLKENGTYEIIMAKGAGLPLGTYKVCVSPPPVFHAIGAAPPQQSPACPDIPAKYRNYMTSGLTTEIKDGENTFDIDMKP